MPIATNTVIHNWLIAIARPGTGSAGSIAERERMRRARAELAAREHHWQALIGDRGDRGATRPLARL